MSIRILYDQRKQTAAMLAQAVQQQLEALASLRRVKTILDKAQWGSPADWASVALELGLIDQPNYTAVQQAQDAYTIYANAVAAIDVPAVNSELGRLDQG